MHWIVRVMFGVLALAAVGVIGLVFCMPWKRFVPPVPRPTMPPGRAHQP